MHMFPNRQCAPCDSYTAFALFELCVIDISFIFICIETVHLNTMPVNKVIAKLAKESSVRAQQNNHARPGANFTQPHTSQKIAIYLVQYYENIELLEICQVH